jgi:hypothetical protein
MVRSILEDIINLIFEFLQHTQDKNISYTISIQLDF